MGALMQNTNPGTWVPANLAKKNALKKAAEAKNKADFNATQESEGDILPSKQPKSNNNNDALQKKVGKTKIPPLPSKIKQSPKGSARSSTSSSSHSSKTSTSSKGRRKKKTNSGRSSTSSSSSFRGTSNKVYVDKTKKKKRKNNNKQKKPVATEVNAKTIIQKNNNQNDAEMEKILKEEAKLILNESIIKETDALLETPPSTISGPITTDPKQSQEFNQNIIQDKKLTTEIAENLKRKIITSSIEISEKKSLLQQAQEFDSLSKSKKEEEQQEDEKNMDSIQQLKNKNIS